MKSTFLTFYREVFIEYFRIDTNLLILMELKFRYSPKKIINLYFYKLTNNLKALNRISITRSWLAFLFVLFFSHHHNNNESASKYLSRDKQKFFLLMIVGWWIA